MYDTKYCLDTHYFSTSAMLIFSQFLLLIDFRILETARTYSFDRCLFLRIFFLSSILLIYVYSVAILYSKYNF